MQLTDLPEEILIIIIHKLDICSLHNIYNASTIFRRIMCLPGVVKQCCISRNIMATGKTLKLDFFKDISNNLSVLNMSGIPNLTKTAVLSAMRQLKNLKVLDVSYTHLDVTDFAEIYNVCPTIKDISINFHCSTEDCMSSQHILKSQMAFENIENVNFVGTFFRLVHSNDPFYLLEKAKCIRHLKLTVAGLRHVRNCKAPVNSCIPWTVRGWRISTNQFFKRPAVEVLGLDQLTILIMNWQRYSSLFVPTVSMDCLTHFEDFEKENNEYVIISIHKFDPIVYTSPKLSSFFKETFNITTRCLKPSDTMFLLNMVVLKWNRATVKFDNNFYRTLAKQVKQYFPYYFESHNEFQKWSDTTMCNWIYSIPSVPVQNDQNLEATNCGTTKNKTAASTFILNYDNVNVIKNLELTLIFQYNENAIVALSPKSLYLKNLTYLSLIQLGRYNFKFFHILFFHCENLVTLNVEASPESSCAAAIAGTLTISRTLKNLRIVDKNIKFTPLFTSFSLYPRLEIVHIIDASCIQNDLADPSILVEKCKQLYSICIEATCANAAKAKTLRLFNKAKGKFDRDYMNVNIKTYGLNENIGDYDIFLDVFRLNPIRPF